MMKKNENTTNNENTTEIKKVTTLPKWINRWHNKLMVIIIILMVVINILNLGLKYASRHTDASYVSNKITDKEKIERMDDTEYYQVSYPDNGLEADEYWSRDNTDINNLKKQGVTYEEFKETYLTHRNIETGVAYHNYGTIVYYESPTTAYNKTIKILNTIQEEDISLEEYNTKQSEFKRELENLKLQQFYIESYAYLKVLKDTYISDSNKDFDIQIQVAKNDKELNELVQKLAIDDRNVIDKVVIESTRTTRYNYMYKQGHENVFVDIYQIYIKYDTENFTDEDFNNLKNSITSELENLLNNRYEQADIDIEYISQLSNKID